MYVRLNYDAAALAVICRNTAADCATECVAQPSLKLTTTFVLYATGYEMGMQHALLK